MLLRSLMLRSCKRLVLFLAFKMLLFPVLFAQDHDAQNVLDTNISLQTKEETLENILSEISRKYQVEFSYSSNLIDISRKITINGNDQPLGQFLLQIFDGYPVSVSAIKTRIIFQKQKEPLFQTIKGKVVDVGSKAPVTGVSVFISGHPGLGSITNEEGLFKIENVPIGRQSLHISHISYEPFHLPSFLVISGKENIFFIELTEAQGVLEEVVVTDGKFQSNHKHDLAVASTQPLNIGEAKRFASSLNDPARMVSSAPGVAGDDFMENSISIRGNSSRGLLWRVEGIDIPNPNHFAEEGASGGGVSIINSHMLDQSHLLTGAFPSRYGNALSGVLDLRLRNGNNETREHYFQAGTMGLDMATEGPFVKGRAASYLINYRYSSFSLLDKVGFSLSPSNTATRFQDMAFKVNLPAQKLGEFSIFGIGGSNAFDIDSVAMGGFSKSKMGIVGLVHAVNINNTTSLKSNFSISGSSINQVREYSFGNIADYQYRERYAKTYARASATLHKKLFPGHNLEAGFIYTQLSYNFKDDINEENSELPLNNFFYFDDQGNAGLTQAYLSGTSKLGNKWMMVNGIHFMYFGLNGKYSIEPRSTLTYQLSATQNIYGAFGIHSRIEPLQYYFARFVTPQQEQIQYNRNLDFTKSRHYVLGYNHLVKPGLLVKVESYYQGLYNVAIQNDTSSIFSSISVYEGFNTNELLNQGTGTNYGIEASFEKSFSKSYYLNINGSLYNATFVAGNFLERNSPYNGSFNTHLLAGKVFGLGADKKQKTISINARAVWRGGKRYIPIDIDQSRASNIEVPDINNAFKNQFDDYRRLDLQVVYRYNLPKFTGEWKIDIFNVTGEKSIVGFNYDRNSQNIKATRQLGIFPVIAYKMEF